MTQDRRDIETKRISRIIIIASIVISALSMWVLFTNDLAEKPLAGQTNFTGQADLGGEFALTNQYGERFTSDQLKGKVSLIYFGFSFCPDICPTSLQKMTNVIQDVAKYGIDINTIFITLDPKRDSVSAMKSYLSNFHDKIIGLTGAEDEIKQVAQKYKIYYAIAASSDTNSNNYMLDHSSFIYLLDKNGNYVQHFAMNSSVEEIVRQVAIASKQSQ